MPISSRQRSLLTFFMLFAAVALGAWQGLPPVPLDEEPDATGESPSPATRAVMHIAVESIIHPQAAEFVTDALEAADEAEAIALVIELNTPGGLLDSTREIFKAMLGARTPVVVFVGPRGARAASAGFFLLMAADVAAMAPGTNTGAAHPVGGQGEDIEGDLGAKVEEDAAATIRALAKQSGRDVELAQAAVLESRSFDAEQALELGLIDLIAEDLQALLAALDGRTVEKAGEPPMVLATRTAPVDRRTMPPIQRFLSAISHPQIAAILLSFGMLGLFVELSHPGMIFPGVVGAICLLVGFYAMSVLPVSYAGIGLLLLAVLLFAAEFFVPSFGVLTLGGAVAMILGGLMLFRHPDPALRLDLRYVLVLTAMIVTVVLALLAKAMQVRRGKVTTGQEGLLEKRGVARTALDPKGKVFVHGELWNAVAKQPVPAGAMVEVAAVDGLRLEVRAIDDAS